MTVEPSVVRDVFAAAALAPSGDNSQPWRVVVRGAHAEVYAEAERADFFVNLTGHATWMALGAFVEAARLAAVQRGFGIALELVGDARGALASDAASKPLARLTFGAVARSAEPRLVAALPQRCCNRARYDGTPLSQAERKALLHETAEAPARLCLSISAAEIGRTARLVGEAEALRAGIREAHEDLHRWLRWTPEEAERTRDGLDVRTLSLRPHERLGLRALRSWSVMGVAAKLGACAMQGAYMRELMQKSAGVLAVIAPKHEPRALVAAGATMLRVWLEATALGLAMSPAVALPLLAAASESETSPIEPARRERLLALRAELDRVCGAASGETVALLLRVGHAAPPVRSLRRPLEDWLTIEPGGPAS